MRRILLGACLFLPGLAHAASSEAVRRALEHVYSDDRFQRIPVPEEPLGNLDLEWLKTAAEVAGPLANVATVLFWVFVAAIAVFLVAIIVRALANRGRAARPSDDRLAATTSTLDPSARRVNRADADSLARDGRFAEAIHALLLAAINELGHDGSTPLKPSATSREIMRALGPLVGTSRDAFGALVQRVEWTLFGGRPADADGYHACVHSYDAFAAGLGARLASARNAGTR